MVGFLETLTGQSHLECLEKVSEVKISLYELMKDYEVEEDEDNTESTAASLVNSGVLSTISARVASRRPTAVRFKSELDRYLNDELVPINTENFNILDWWKVAGTRYPTLRKIARDIYAIQLLAQVERSLVSIAAGSLHRYWRP